jgi:hypothetical protein
MKTLTIPQTLLAGVLALAACDDLHDEASAGGREQPACSDDVLDETESGGEEDPDLLPPVPPLKPFPSPEIAQMHVEVDLDSDLPRITIEFESSNGHVGELEVTGGSSTQPIQTVEVRHDGELVSRQKVDLSSMITGAAGQCHGVESTFELGAFATLEAVYEADTAHLYALAVEQAAQQEGWAPAADEPTNCELGCGIVGSGVGAGLAAGAVGKACPPVNPWCIGLGAAAGAAGAFLGWQACNEIFCD